MAHQAYEVARARGWGESAMLRAIVIAQARVNQRVMDALLRQKTEGVPPVLLQGVPPGVVEVGQ